jgi:hypothetical protein
VYPNVTPKIKGNDFFIPKLKPEYDPTILFGPGVKAAAIEKKISGSKLGYIAMVYAISKPFSTF